MKIACIGNITYDYSVYKEGFIEEGVRNSFNNVQTSPGGPASNAAYVLSKFGSKVSLYGKIGNDESGKYIYNQMKKENIDLTHVSISNEFMTPYSFIINNLTNNTRTICTVRAKNDYGKSKIEDITYETGYNYILTDGKYYEESLKLIKENPQAVSIIDAGRATKEILLLCRSIDYIICSEDFANEVTKNTIGDNEQENKEIYKKLKSYFPNALELVITIGKNGYICMKDDETLIMPSYNSGKQAIDTTGAGDIFHGAFTHAISSNYTFHESLEFANITASLSTTKNGGRYSCPDLTDVESRLKTTHKKLIKRK